MEKEKIPINIDDFIDPKVQRETNNLLLHYKRLGYKIVIMPYSVGKMYGGLVFDLIPPEKHKG
jgi:hypothetical protein